MRLFLDIDGVFLLRGGALAQGAEAFLCWAVANHTPLWLSTRTRTGENTGACQALAQASHMDMVSAIPAAAFGTVKTDALPLDTGGWLWIDDGPLWSERAVLAKVRAERRLLLTRSDKETQALARLPSRINNVFAQSQQ